MNILNKDIADLSQLLVGQFILCHSQEYIPPEWKNKSIGKWLLAVHKDLNIIEIISYKNQHLGWLLGQPISAAGKIVTDKIIVELDSEDINAANKFETLLYDEFGGRYVAIYITSHTSRIYLDPGGFLAVMFSPSQKIVTSSIALIPQENARDQDEELIAALDIPNQDNWYPFGLSPRLSVKRLLPNHFINLDTWETTRHWPHERDITKIAPVQPVIEEISMILTRQVEALASKYPTYLSLTAGRDSRCVLAASRNYIDRIHLFTINTNKVDTNIACKIANKFNLNHILIEFQEPTQLEIEQWLMRTSYCVAGGVLRNARSIQQLNPSYVRLGGMAGEVGRCFYWRKGDTQYNSLSPQEIVHRLKLPATKSILEGATNWLHSLPQCNTFEILDLLYIEQRCGCWAGIQQYGNGQSSFGINPFCHRRIFQLMLSLDPIYKLRKRLSVDIIKHLWNDLLLFPFNPHPSLSRKVSGYLKHLWDVKIW
ncbi:hypothetical protein [Aulosira sp. FACHB-615]|uniref:hypothetical protein n=1 Tax=Aulosira sp. FACHB-615 TaxID=2692777 RepID=UPI001687FEC4|nr:hypothetical protein [Aulosira sp. FACHB-615]MBD2486987.1 hypothetical protein [Aulosira sp. FACHB-615]